MAEDEDLGFQAEDTKLRNLKLEDANDPEAKQRQERVKKLQADVAKTPKDAALWGQLGNALFAIDRPDEALQAFDKAIGLDPKKTSYYVDKASALMQQGENEDAIEVLNKALAVDPNNGNVLFKIGKALQADERGKEADSYFRKAFEKDPKHAGAAYQVASYLINQHDPATKQKRQEEALKYFTNVIALSPKYIDAYYHAGVILQSKGGANELKEAAKFFADGVAADGTDGKLRTKLIQAYDALGMKKEAAAARASLHEAFHKKTLQSSFLGNFRYLCCQFEVGDHFVMGYDYFNLVGPEAVKYVFNVFKKGEIHEDKMLYRVSLGSYEETNKIARKNNQLGKDDRLFHVDAYFSDKHQTFAMYNREPDYDTVRALVTDIVSGKAKAIITSALKK